MHPVLSREQIRSFDRYAIQHCSVPGLVLMENAGRGACDIFVEHLARAHGRSPDSVRVLLVCGVGNNGADGLVLARRLLVVGASPEVVLLGQIADLRGDASVNAGAFLGIGGRVLELVDSQLSALELRLRECHFVVDAVFGTGLSRDVGGFQRGAIELMNASGKPCVALDIPSGLDADTGRVLGICTRPELTITFAHRKLGQLMSGGAAHCGRLLLADIGVPAGLVTAVGNSAWCVEASDVRACLKRLSTPAHKGEAGRVLVVAGSPGTVGAAQLAARGAQRAGAGLVTIASFPEVIRALEGSAWETMTLTVESSRWEQLDVALRAADSVVLGPGIGLGAQSDELVARVLANYRGRLIVDADALSLFSDRAADLASFPAELVLTPHPGEAGRLLGVPSKDIEADRFGALQALVARTGAAVLLKGRRTLVGASQQLPFINTSGNDALATAGSGDVLAGLVAALACELLPHEAAFSGAWLHGAAAESCSRKSGARRGLLAREIADSLPGVIADCFDGLSDARDRLTD